MTLDVGRLRDEAHQEPVLALSRVTPTPDGARKLGRKVIAQFTRGPCDDLDAGCADSGFFLELAQRRLLGGLAGVDPTAGQRPLGRMAVHRRRPVAPTRQAGAS